MRRRGFLRILLLAPFASSVARTIAKRIVKPIVNDPWVDYWSKRCVGYKGASFMETGIVYAPYIPLYTTDMLIEGYNKKPINTYCTKKTINTDC